MSDYEMSSDLADMTPAERLTSVGVTIPQPAAPAAAYVGHVVVGDLLHTAGQLPLVDGELLATGLVGDAVDLTLAQQCARQCAINVLAQVHGSGRDLDDIVRIVKLTVFVASAAGFTEQHLVANGASEFLGEIFGDVGAHARAAVGVASLPLGAPVEIEAVLQVTDG